MSGKNTGNSNQVNVPEAKDAMDRFKMEVANEIGVPLKSGYNGDLTSYQNGSVGGYMVKKMIEERKDRWPESKPSFPGNSHAEKSCMAVSLAIFLIQIPSQML